MPENEHKPEPRLGSAPCSAFIGFRDPKKPITASMDNVIASRLGDIARCAGDPKRTDVGDSIDRGLILRRMLEEAGLSLIISPDNNAANRGKVFKRLAFVDKG